MKIDNKLLIAIGVIAVFIIAMVAVQLFVLNGQNNAAPSDNVPEVKTIQTLDETFTKADLKYGPQSWKPYNTKMTLVPGESVDAEGKYYLMFVDLNSSVPATGNTSLRTVKVDYNFTGLQGVAAFHVYGQATGQLSWTNPMDDSSASGYYVKVGPATGDSLSGTQPLEKPTGVNITVSNDAGSIYKITFNKAGGGLNSLHISNVTEPFGGRVVNTDKTSGSFYIMYSGDKGLDGLVLLVAVSGPIPSDFQLHLKAGYVI